MTTTLAEVTSWAATAAVGVVAGVDTHKDTHQVAVLAAATGARLGNLKVPATPAGYAHLLDFVAGFGPVVRIGVEAPIPTALAWPGSWPPPAWRSGR